ncbi:testosterone 17-beta-dehydrogenase 3 isoform X3 [Tachyglossus aculeatus]|uniref:testosterone 17-beta-dehydrogenase 3 isoform X3 n=1 Tax=Tachyglossus aculeatus TaxID=9261 RepID=UPI0018F3EB4A|nr:testosterone 17-beta-dehydrogenase 3 isoform X3 [Tachyglossus aculeatus]
MAGAWDQAMTLVGAAACWVAAARCLLAVRFLLLWALGGHRAPARAAFRRLGKWAVGEARPEHGAHRQDAGKAAGPGRPDPAGNGARRAADGGRLHADGHLRGHPGRAPRAGRRRSGEQRRPAAQPLPRLLPRRARLGRGPRPLQRHLRDQGEVPIGLAVTVATAGLVHRPHRHHGNHPHVTTATIVMSPRQPSSWPRIHRRLIVRARPDCEPVIWGRPGPLAPLRALLRLQGGDPVRRVHPHDGAPAPQLLRQDPRGLRAGGPGPGRLGGPSLRLPGPRRLALAAGIDPVGRLLQQHAPTATA